MRFGLLFLLLLASARPALRKSRMLGPPPGMIPQAVV